MPSPAASATARTLRAFLFFVAPLGFSLNAVQPFARSLPFWACAALLLAASAAVGALSKAAFTPFKRSALDAQTLSGLLRLLALLSVSAAACSWALAGALGRGASWFGLFPLPAVSSPDRSLAATLSEALSHIAFLAALVGSGSLLHAVKSAAALRAPFARRKARSLLRKAAALRKPSDAPELD